MKFADDGEQEVYELMLKDDRLQCTCDESVREESYYQAKGHYHHCMLWQTARAIELSFKMKPLAPENKLLKDQISYATGYAARALMEHNVSFTFIQNYVKTYGDKDEWVNIVYLKELFEIVAKPISVPNNKESAKEGE